MANVSPITSATNPLIKEVRRAASRGGLTSQGWCIAESFHLLKEALRSDCEVQAVIAAESALPQVEAQLRHLADLQLAVLPDHIFQTVSTTEHAQGVIALVEPIRWTIDQIFEGQSLVAVLDGIQDPGNAGTIARAAEAFGATGMIFLKGSVNPFNPKALRASAGSLFRLPFVYGVMADQARIAIRSHGVTAFAAMPSHAPSPDEVDLTLPCALLIGSEARGVSGELRGVARDIAIPTAGVESLNAGVAASILLYEARRQRMQGV